MADPTCCAEVWYCTPYGPVSQPPGVAPSGATGGPWIDEDEAERGCPLGDGFICGDSGMYAQPAAIFLSFLNKTGYLTILPNSIRIVLSTTPIEGYYYNSFFCGEHLGVLVQIVCYGSNGTVVRIYINNGSAYPTPAGFPDSSCWQETIFINTTGPEWSPWFIYGVPVFKGFPSGDISFPTPELVASVATNFVPHYGTADVWISQ